MPDLSDDAVAGEREIVNRYLEHLETPSLVPAGEAEMDFVAVVIRFSIRHGFGFQAWRELGVPACVLVRAGFEID